MLNSKGIGSPIGRKLNLYASQVPDLYPSIIVELRASEPVLNTIVLLFGEMHGQFDYNGLYIEYHLPQFHYKILYTFRENLLQYL